MRRCTVAVELEDKRVRAVVVKGAARRARVCGVLDRTLDSISRATLRAALGELCGGLSRERTTVRVAIGDRRIVPGTVAREARPRKHELGGVVAEAARAAGMFAETEELVIGYVEQVGRGWRAAFEAAPRRIVEDVHGALVELGFAEVFVTSAESVLASGFAAAGGAAAAVIDVRQDRARLVLARRGVSLSSRKFKLPFPLGQEGAEPDQLCLPLASEITRSLELFAGQGLPAPARLVCAGDLAGAPELVGSIAEVLPMPCAVGAHPALSLLEGHVDAPSAWSGPALLIAGIHVPLPYLVEPSRRSRLQRVGLGALTTGGALAVASGLWLGSKAWSDEGRARQRELARLEARGAELAEEIAELRAALEPPRVVRERREILAALDRGRVSVSKLLATLARDKPADVLLTHLSIASGVLTVQGVIRAGAPRVGERAGQLGDCLGSVQGVRLQGIRLDETDPARGGVPFTYVAAVERGGDA